MVLDIQIKAAVEMRLDTISGLLSELGPMLIEMQMGDLGIDSKTTEVDLVTKADYASEAKLIGFLQSQFPEDRILSEEGSCVDIEQPDGSFQWVLDPIDGTVNYANGLPMWVISIGLLYEGQRVGGIVEAPLLRERFRAISGCGATLNGVSIRVNNKARLQQGVVGTGFPYDRAQRAVPLCETLANMLRESGGVRRIGAAALDLCYVAAGRFVGYYEMSLKPWDSAAGSLIVEEAGGCVSDMSGQPLDIMTSKGLIASNGIVQRELVQAVVPMLEAIKIKV